ncbi:MAG: zinc ribbon domain-containing protein [Paludisphaera borealis]|uniref:FmdB family zinc ribbon protein n=1 Tax=Paludisphaera borealis TaxID=1387353 RepID=UPI0028483FD6|nr:zinc ribbon domain-containing protein [Paludisphaera borealis]MDR3622432.1 zinc ribbon domain-containing protein [Paludisphaera borealis]
MALYEFACPGCTPVEAFFPMGAAPDSLECPECGGRAERRISTPRLSIAGTSAFKLIDAAKKSAHEPQVVSGALPQSGRKRATPTTTNPLHRKLPRP